MDEQNISIQLNIRINDYSIIIGKELDTVLLKKCNYLKPNFVDRLIIKPPKGQVVWWSKNPTLRYLNEIGNSIAPNLGEIDKNPDTMYGTSVYLFYKENKLIRCTFQIIQNKMIANLLLNKLSEEVVKTIGNPSSKSDNLIIWESPNEQFSIEFPKRIHGYIHLTGLK
jgi:hypothetical protein